MKQEHLEQARHNAGLFRYLEENIPDSFHDWKVTICFYEALHLVRAFLCTQGIGSSDNHNHTLNCINPRAREKPPKHVPMPGLYPAYFRMYQLSKAARYHGFLQKRSFEQQQMDNFKEAKECLGIIQADLLTRGFQWLASQPIAATKKAR